jgi:hypothetical protein
MQYSNALLKIAVPLAHLKLASSAVVTSGVLILLKKIKKLFFKLTILSHIKV